MCPIGFVTCAVKIGTKKITNNFIVCKHLMRPVTIGRDFIYQNDIKVSYCRTVVTCQEKEFQNLDNEFSDVFSSDSRDIGQPHTPDKNGH